MTAPAGGGGGHAKKSWFTSFVETLGKLALIGVVIFVFFYAFLPGTWNTPACDAACRTQRAEASAAAAEAEADAQQRIAEANARAAAARAQQNNFAVANGYGGHRRGHHGSRSRLRPDQDAFVHHNGLERNPDTGFWEKQITAPAGTPPPPQGWRRDGPGRGRWVCTSGACLYGR